MVVGSSAVPLRCVRNSNAVPDPVDTSFCCEAPIALLFFSLRHTESGEAQSVAITELRQCEAVAACLIASYDLLMFLCICFAASCDYSQNPSEPVPRHTGLSALFTRL